MSKQSAGLLLFRFTSDRDLQVLLVHPGGPFWRNKDKGAWSIPKGEYEGEDAPLLAAKREFKEEIGIDSPTGDYIALQPVKIKSGKVIAAWAVQSALEIQTVRSNSFEMEWPPRSGNKQHFPEVDRAEWFSIPDAKIKMNSGQLPFLEQLTAMF